MTSARCLFSAFDVSRQVFLRTPLSLAIVNLKPLIPGHVLVLPKRVCPRLADLSGEEVSDLFMTVQRVGRVIEREYHAQALTISLQDGAAAGQTVPHVHVHILPRKTTTDFGEKDDVYPALEANEQDLAQTQAKAETFGGSGPKVQGPGVKWEVHKDEDRHPRTEDEMEKEAVWLASFFPDGHA